MNVKLIMNISILLLKEPKPPGLGYHKQYWFFPPTNPLNLKGLRGYEGMAPVVTRYGVGRTPQLSDPQPMNGGESDTHAKKFGRLLSDQ